MQDETTCRFKLPTRVRFGPDLIDAFVPRIALAERISELPEVTVRERGDDAVGGTVDVYIHSQVTRLGKVPPARLFCRIDHEAITVYGLDDWEKHQVLAGGWGNLHLRNVRLHMPRNETETDVCWTILRQAYDALRTTPVAPGMCLAPRPVWPSYSRTKLQ